MTVGEGIAWAGAAIALAIYGAISIWKEGEVGLGYGVIIFLFLLTFLDRLTEGTIG